MKKLRLIAINLTNYLLCVGNHQAFHRLGNLPLLGGLIIVQIHSIKM